MNFSYVPIIFWAILYFLAQENVPGLSCNFPASALQFAISPRSSGVENDIWKLKSGYLVAYCFWGSSTVGLLMYRGGSYTHVNVCMCVCICVCTLRTTVTISISIYLCFKGPWICTGTSNSINTSGLFLAFPLSFYVTSFSVNKKTFIRCLQYGYLCTQSLCL